MTNEVNQLTSESSQVQTDGVRSTANILAEVAAYQSTDPEVTATFNSLYTKICSPWGLSGQTSGHLVPGVGGI